VKRFKLIVENTYVTGVQQNQVTDYVDSLDILRIPCQFINNEMIMNNYPQKRPTKLQRKDAIPYQMRCK
jgi:hypothetical protein